MEITYGEFLPTATNNLKNMRKKIINCLAYFLNNNQISNYVSLIVAMIDKSCFLIDGYIDCLLNKNLTVAGLIVRAQIDVCMRVYGLSLIENKEFVCKEILSGKQLKNFKDKNGKQLRDGYLKEQLDIILNKTKRVYNKASGYAHFSNVAFSHCFVNLNGTKLKLQVGHIKESDEKYLIEGYDVMMYYLIFLCENLF